MPDIEHDHPYPTRHDRAQASVFPTPQPEPTAPTRPRTSFRDAMVRAGLRQDLLPEHRPLPIAPRLAQPAQDGPGAEERPGDVSSDGADGPEASWEGLA